MNYAWKGDSMDFEIARGLLIPFLGTALGAACVLFMRKSLNPKVEKALTGFAAGVMVAASIWSLIDRKSTRLNSSHL